MVNHSHSTRFGLGLGKLMIIKKTWFFLPNFIFSQTGPENPLKWGGGFSPNLMCWFFWYPTRLYSDVIFTFTFHFHFLLLLSAESESETVGPNGPDMGVQRITAKDVIEWQFRMVFISHSVLRVKRFKIWKIALQKGVGMGQQGFLFYERTQGQQVCYRKVNW